MDYDVIVVGAGSSGAVIASRVSAHKNVLLLEAGPDYCADDLPADLSNGLRGSLREHDWGYRMRCNARSPLTLDYPRGKVVGGSSAVNTCIALRGRPKDYDEWGFPEWRWERCLPAFKRLEHDLDFPHKPWHGAGGPLPVRRFASAERAPWQEAFVEAGEAEGYPPCVDSNDPAMPVGIGPHSMNLVNGERMSVARCYLTDEVRQRDTFELRANTIVRRLLVERGRAAGVEVQTRGMVQQLRAKRVVLCGGAIGTPGLMLRSGLGPQKSVERLGVPLVREVPGVAEQLLEHPGAAIFLRPRLGVLSTRHPIVQTVLRLDDMYLQPCSHVPLGNVRLPLLTLGGHVGKPKLASRIVFTSADPAAKPQIFARAMDDPSDRKKMRETLQIGVRLARNPAMKGLAKPFFPSARVLDDDDAFDEWLQRWSGTGYHPCGTVPMGVSADDHGRVRGVPGLYVADASLMPTIPMANINLTVIMMGERFGEWLSTGVLAH